MQSWAQASGEWREGECRSPPLEGLRTQQGGGGSWQAILLSIYQHKCLTNKPPRRTPGTLDGKRNWDRKREREGVSEREWKGVSSSRVATRLKSCQLWSRPTRGETTLPRWNCNSLVCLHRKRKLAKRSKDAKAWQVYLSVCVCVCRFQNGNYLRAYLPTGQRSRNISFRFVFSAFSHFLLLLSGLLFNSCYFHSLFSVVVYFVIRYYCVFLHSP